MEDSQIVELYLSRQECAIARTSEKYGSRLRAIAHRITEDPGAAEECENDTYLAAWNAIPPHEPRSYLFAFLARITRHLSLNLCRERGALKRSAYILELTGELGQCLAAPEEVEQELNAMELKDTINGFLGRLTPEKRNIFLRRYWFLDSIEAIAWRYGISQSKVKTTLHRCRKQLGEHLRKEGYTL